MVYWLLLMYFFLISYCNFINIKIKCHLFLKALILLLIYIEICMKKKTSIFLTLFWLMSIILSAIILRSKIIKYQNEVSLFVCKILLWEKKNSINYKVNQSGLTQLALFSVKFVSFIFNLLVTFFSENFEGDSEKKVTFFYTSILINKKYVSKEN